MTNDDLRSMEIGLLQMKRMSLRPVLNMMVTYCLNFFKPATSALNTAHNDIRVHYFGLDPQSLDKPDPRNPDGSYKLLEGMLEEDYGREVDELFKAEVEVPLPKFRFRVTDFIESNISFSPEITQQLGPLVNFDGFEDFVANIQRAMALPTKGATVVTPKPST